MNIDKVLKSKWFLSKEWNEYELSQLRKLVENYKISHSRLGTIQYFKEYNLKSWLPRFRRIYKNPYAKNLYYQCLRYGKIEGSKRWAEISNKMSYKSSKEGIIDRLGEEAAEAYFYKMGEPFRCSERQRANALKFAEKRKQNPEKYDSILPSQVSYYTKLGYNRQEAEQLVTERQTTLSLEICIKKYGKTKGTEIWQARQDKWQSTLNSKPQDEIDDFNRRKNPCLIKKDETKEEFKERLKNIGEIVIYDNEDLVEFITSKLKDPKWKYLSREFFISKLPFIENASLSPQEILDKIEFEFPAENKIHKKGRFYSLNTPEGYLRSSCEIDFYYMLKNENIRFEIEKLYDNQSTHKCDFYIPQLNMFIEIAGTENNEEYNKHMEFKRVTYGAYIVLPSESKEFIQYIKERLQIEKD